MTHRIIGIGSAALLLLLPTFVPQIAAGGNAFGGDEIVIALIDSGIRPTHQEFDYRGQHSADDQIVAWWDFSTERAPAHRPPPGATWDPFVADPYDLRGHGTGTAAMAVGRDLNAFKSPAFCRGCKLAVAKVTHADGGIGPEETAAAIRWATEDVGADVISISIGFSVAGTGVLVGALVELDEAVVAAREAGVLVVVAGGNGPLNRGGPGHASWLQGFGDSTSALIVGGASVNGGTPDSATFSHDPEVVAHAVSVRTASIASDTAYVTGSGSSYAAPAVAGMAAHVLAVGLAAGCALTPDSTEALLKGVARDTILPATFEGHGFLGAAEAARAYELASQCATPPSPTTANAAHEAATARLRWLGSDGLDTEATTAWTIFGRADNSLGLIAAGAGQGAIEIEAWGVDLEVGERLESVARPPGRADILHDLDLFLFRPGAAADGILTGDERILSSSLASSGPDTISYRAPVAGRYLVVVAPFLTVDDTVYSFELTVDGTTRAADSADEWTVLGSSYHG